MYTEGLDKNIAEIAEHLRSGGRMSVGQAAELWHGAPLSLLGALARERKIAVSGDTVFYNRNFHIEPTNICLFRCGFCSYRREERASDAWDYSVEQIEDIARSYVGKDVTEVHIVGGVHPRNDLFYYADMIRRVKAILPNVAIKAFTAVELAYMIEKAGLSYREGLAMLREAGMEAIPGGGAEIFDESLRARICPEKGDTKTWLEMHETAHGLGYKTNATILYGHIESIPHRIDHMNRLRELQDRTGGFDAFIPLKYRAANNSMGEIGEVSITEDLRMLSMARLFLDNFPHIKAYWVMYGKATAEMALSFGADDIDGTIDDTTKIYSMAGAEDQRPRLTIEEIELMARSAGLRAVERDTFYREVVR